LEYRNLKLALVELQRHLWILNYLNYKPPF
jgi:hypothetical protein